MITLKCVEVTSADNQYIEVIKDSLIISMRIIQDKLHIFRHQFTLSINTIVFSVRQMNMSATSLHQFDFTSCGV